ncbi:hypothetical protein H2204_005200 [Knufia peltigerae]|uniref:BTB domain-containing protein n=1 Tax=Knufia peltigerae TaxID=1002370 RepID=A0AA39CYQ8_9EURO|nr:hypothetical protein H2204_005200 [Knufia peltigerae]
MFSDAPDYLKPPQIDAGQDYVQIFVGESKKPTYCHKALICACSRFFACAFLGPYEEGSQNKMNLPEEEPRLFQIFLEWLYERPLSLDAYMDYFEIDADQMYLDIFHMAHRLAVDKLCAVALYELHDMFDSFGPPFAPSGGFIEQMYETDLLPRLRCYIIKHTAYWDVQGAFRPLDHSRLRDSAATNPVFRSGLEATKAEMRAERRRRVDTLSRCTLWSIAHPQQECRAASGETACDGKCLFSKETLINHEVLYPRK